jgi:hypothetical protein
MIIEVFVTQRQPINPLRQQLLHRVIHVRRLPPIAKALGEAGRQTQAGIHLSHQQHAAIAGERSAGKIGRDFS